MQEIQPISSFPIVKPQKPKKNDKRMEKQPRKNKQGMDEPGAEPIVHIDEIV